MIVVTVTSVVVAVASAVALVVRVVHCVPKNSHNLENFVQL